MEKEGVSFEREDLKTIVNQFYPDLRKCLNTIQLSIVHDKVKGEDDKWLKIDKSVLVSSNYMTQVLKELTKRNLISITLDKLLQMQTFKILKNYIVTFMITLLSMLLGPKEWWQYTLTNIRTKLTSVLTRK
jgi:hypothetical protein